MSAATTVEEARIALDKAEAQQEAIPIREIEEADWKIPVKVALSAAYKYMEKKNDASKNNGSRTLTFLEQTHFLIIDIRLMLRLFTFIKMLQNKKCPNNLPNYRNHITV